MDLLKFALGGVVMIGGLSQQVAASMRDSHGPDQSIRLSYENVDYSDGYGSLGAVTLEYKADLGDTTIVVAPTFGERNGGGLSSAAFGIGGTVYHDWSNQVSTRTRAFVAQDEPVFAKLDLAQDVSFNVADNTSLTVGARWARYFGNRDVTFLSAGVRRYFNGGSIAYRFTFTRPEGRKGFDAHLVNLTLNDAEGAGKTQFWFGTGADSLTHSQLNNNFSGHDYGGLVQRTQPLGQDVNLLVSAGMTSYARPAGRIESTNLGIGLQFPLAGDGRDGE